MIAKIVCNQALRLRHKISGFRTKLPDRIFAAQDRPVAADDHLRIRFLNGSDRLKIRVNIKIGWTECPSATQRLVARSLNRVAVEQCAVFSVIDTQMSVAVAGQMPRLQNPVAPQAHNFTANKAERHFLRSRRTISYFLLSFRVKINLVILPVGIVPEGKQKIRRFDHLSIRLSAGEPNSWILPSDLGRASAMIAVRVSHDEPGQILFSQTRIVQVGGNIFYRMVASSAIQEQSLLPLLKNR